METKDESQMTKEEKRREARKKRIQGNINDRLSFISSHTEQLKNEEIKPEEELKQQQQQQKQQPTNLFDLLNSQGSQTPQPKLKDPISFTILRWSGILLFSILFFCIAILTCSPELLEQANKTLLSQQQSEPINNLQLIMNKYEWLVKTVVSKLLEQQISINERGTGGSVLGTSQTIRQTIYTYGSLLAVWLIWEYIVVYRFFKNKSAAVRQKTFLSIARSDALLIAFCYTVILDLCLRYKDSIFNFEQLIYIKDSYVISTLYYPVLISVIGQFIINNILKIDLVQMNPMINKVAQGVTHFALSLFILLVCIDWWECSSCYCRSFGLLYIIASKSRGLFLWSHICINFASRILP